MLTGSPNYSGALCGVKREARNPGARQFSHALHCCYNTTDE